MKTSLLSIMLFLVTLGLGAQDIVYSQQGTLSAKDTLLPSGQRGDIHKVNFKEAMLVEVRVRSFDVNPVMTCNAGSQPLKEASVSTGDRGEVLILMNIAWPGEVVFTVSATEGEKTADAEYKIIVTRKTMGPALVPDKPVQGMWDPKAEELTWYRVPVAAGVMLNVEALSHFDNMLVVLPPFGEMQIVDDVRGSNATAVVGGLDRNAEWLVGIAPQSEDISTRYYFLWTRERVTGGALSVDAPVEGILDSGAEEYRGRPSIPFTFIPEPGVLYLIRMTGDFDTFLTVMQNEDNVWENDDSGGEEGGSYIPAIFPDATPVTVYAQGYNSEKTGAFSLTLAAVSPLLNEVIELNENSSVNEEDHFFQRVEFRGEPGQSVVILLSLEGSGEMDPYLEIRSSRERSMETNDDGGMNRNSAIEIEVPQDGILLIDAGVCNHELDGRMRLTVYPLEALSD